MADWDRVEADLRWCLVEGRGVDGKSILVDALQMRDVDRGRENMRRGFGIAKRDEEAVANFLACEREDGPRLFDLGRKVLGLRPAATVG